MFQFYEFVSENAHFKKLKVDQLLFTEYDCPLEASPLEYLTTRNYFTFMIRGRVIWKVPGHVIEAGPGDAVFVVKGLQRVFRVSDDDFCALLIFMPDEFIEEVITKNKINLKRNPYIGKIGPVIPLQQDDILSVYTSSLLHYFAQPDPPTPNLLRIRFEELIIHLLESQKNPQLAAHFQTIVKQHPSSLREVMEKHFVYNLKLEEYARLAGYSLATFKREFPKTYGTSPGKWLKARRLEYSTYLLESTNLSVNQITLESGFKNTSHYIKSFREKFNCTPSDFRRQVTAPTIH